MRGYISYEAEGRTCYREVLGKSLDDALDCLEFYLSWQQPYLTIVRMTAVEIGLGGKPRGKVKVRK